MSATTSFPTIVQVQTNIFHMRILVQMVDSVCVEWWRPTLDTMNVVALGQQQFGKIRTILAGNSDNKCLHPVLNKRFWVIFKSYIRFSLRWQVNNRKMVMPDNIIDLLLRTLGNSTTTRIWINSNVIPRGCLRSNQAVQSHTLTSSNKLRFKLEYLGNIVPKQKLLNKYNTWQRRNDFAPLASGPISPTVSLSPNDDFVSPSNISTPFMSQSSKPSGPEQ